MIGVRGLATIRTGSYPLINDPNDVEVNSANAQDVPALCVNRICDWGHDFRITHIECWVFVWRKRQYVITKRKMGGNPTRNRMLV
jgi:hypothetical protein